MRAPLPVILVIVLVAGCATPGPSSDATPGAPTSGAPTPAASAPTGPVTPAAGSPDVGTPPASPPPSPEVFLGVVLDETHDFGQGGRKVSTFNVTGAERKVVLEIQSAGPPADGSFSSASALFYYPNSTSPFLAELSGQEATDYTREYGAHQGMWRIVYDGAGKTSVHIRVTLA